MIRKWVFRIITTLCLLSTVVFIFSNSLQDATTSGAQSDKVVETVQGVVNQVFPSNPPTVTSKFVRKSAHFTEFALLGFLAVLTYLSYTNNRKFVWVIPTFGFTTAVVDEVLQLFVDGRAGAVLDVFIDFSGVIFGILIAMLTCFIFLKIIKSIKKNTDKKSI